MGTAPLSILLSIGHYAPWYVDWIWGIPLVLLTVMTHVFGLSFIISDKRLVTDSDFIRRHPHASFMAVMGLTTLVAIGLHGFEAAVWAYAYCLTGALPEFKSAMLYSLNSMTAYGHTNLQLEPRWYLLGAIEALNGLLLFGLSTAALFSMIQKLSVRGRARS
jgi:hypothetical protein